MSKGNKKDAALKFIERKEKQFKSSLAYKDEELAAARSKCNFVMGENERLTKENAELQLMLTYLLDKAELSKEDIKVAIHKDEESSKLRQMFNSLLSNRYF